MPAFANAFVTGASSGIGRALARCLALRGTRVAATARRIELLDELAREVRAAGGSIEIARLDVADPAAVHEAVRRFDRELGGLDLVVANAGVGSGVTGAELDWESVKDVLAVNVTGAFATLMAALPLLRGRGRGTLCGVSSLAAIHGMPGSGAYSASKAALSTFLESLAIDLAGTGLRVCDVQPGFVRSPMTDQNDTPMPFLMECEPAVQRVVRGLERGRGFVTFPWQLAWPARTFVRPLPRGLWIRLARTFLRRA